ncbi:MAG: flavin reductase family protein [Desulfofustis sp.]|jgi:flavin reductase (DIM6/NTAB) family NADH-FMN oxidoreductase RutF|nr:flavin reductase family protein [Desulfofustis sp.]
MAKIQIDGNHVFLYPMPMVLVGAVIDGKANFMAVGWVSRVNMKPPLFSIALGHHHTNKGIEEHQEFSINIPDVSLMEKTDYCGLISGEKHDKSRLFEVFYGELKHAPLIAQCPVSIACTVYTKVKLPFDTLYIGEPKEVFTEEKYLTEKKLDVQKMKPFTLTMPDNNYWSVGSPIGKAWSVGKGLKT